MLQLAQRTEAPNSASVSISTAVWMVMCNEPVMRTPCSGLDAAYFLRTAMRPGISSCATSVSLRPQSARVRSLTLKSAALPGVVLMVLMRLFWFPAKLLDRPLEGRRLVCPFPGDANQVVHFAEMAVIGGFAVDG